MTDHTFRTTYDVRSYLVNARRELGLCSLLNILQDVAWRHADLQGYGWDEAVRRGTFWVMTRQALRVTAPARLGEVVAVRTWLRPAEGAVVIRDFVVTADDRPLARGAMSFMLMDVHTRRARRDGITLVEDQVNAHGALDLVPVKIAPRADAVELERFRVRNSDLDVNAHVNNTRYAQWILDAVPYAQHGAYTLTSYDICFLAEAKGGDEVAIFTADGPPTTHFEGRRRGDDKVVFTARVGVR